jgi:hypothetical protein
MYGFTASLAVPCTRISVTALLLYAVVEVVISVPGMVWKDAMCAIPFRLNELLSRFWQAH